MNVQDSIADMLTRLRNALKARYRTVTMPASRQKTLIIQVLKNVGYVSDFSLEEDGSGRKNMTIVLKYQGNKPNIKKITRVSKPSLRVYRSYQSIVSAAGGLGLQILSTSKGIMTDNEARRYKVGGEILCEIV